MRFYTYKPRLNTAEETVGARAGAASAIWLLAVQKKGLEGRAGNKVEPSLHGRATLGMMAAQGSRDRRSAVPCSRPEKGGGTARLGTH